MGVRLRERKPRKRFEWTPIYCKESPRRGLQRAFGVEEFPGVRKHAMEHYVDSALRAR